MRTENISRIGPSIGAFLLATLALAFASCASSPAGASVGRPIAKSDDIALACFEVVSAKPDTDPLVYEKPLDWSVLGFRERNDAYYSLGTAFAINDRELVSAAHVVGFLEDSPFAPRRFVRERRRVGAETVERVYEIDRITAYDSKKDYAVFTVKDATFGHWFASAPAPSFNTKIGTAGYAYGEGLVVRSGTLLDALPEDDAAEWEYLKSTAPVNPGNSGGPLLDASNKVVGIVLSRKDDFCYSLPVSEIEQGRGRAYRRQAFGFAAVGDRVVDADSKEIGLPKPYRDFMREAQAFFEDRYVAGMTRLFDSLKGEFFPEGGSSRAALHASGSAPFPQVYLKATDSGQWFCTDLKPSVSEIGDDGRVAWARLHENSAAWLMRVERPESLSAELMRTDPKTLMDAVLKGINVTRNLTEKDPGSRIVSYGEPLESSAHLDRWGRSWRLDVWPLSYMDRAALTLTAPLPDGAALIYMTCAGSEIPMIKLDLKRMADLTVLSYVGTLDDWSSFLLGVSSYAPHLSGADVSWESGGAFGLSCDGLRIEGFRPPFDVNGDCTLGLYFDVHPRGGDARNALRRIVLDDGLPEGAAASVFRWIKPEGSLPKSFMDEWKAYVEAAGHPYGGLPFFESGKTSIGAVLPRDPASASAASVFLRKSGPVPDADMRASLEAAKAAISWAD